MWPPIINIMDNAARKAARSLIHDFGEIEQLQGMNAQLQQQIKELQGDLQTAQRESVSDRKRVEVEKFKSKLSEVQSDAKADRRVQSNKLTNAVKLEMEKLKPQIEEFGESVLIIRAVPKIVSTNDPNNYLNDLIGQIGDEDTLGTKEHKYLATIACHSSVKAGDNLVNKEMIEILEKLRITTSPFSCPHGRPTILNFTYNKLEKDFRRIN